MVRKNQETFSIYTGNKCLTTSKCIYYNNVAHQNKGLRLYDDQFKIFNFYLYDNQYGTEQVVYNLIPRDNGVLIIKRQILLQNTTSWF